jgi:hemerythrin-like domain-containing protein
MTSTVPTAPAALTPRPAAPAPVAPSRPAPTAPDLTGFVLVHRALRSGTRLLAGAVDGIARDDVCDRERQRGITRFACAVLTEVRAHVEREDAALWRLVIESADEWCDLAPLTAHHAELDRILQRAWAALPVFARCASSGAPLLAPALAELADLVEEHLNEEEAGLFPRIRALGSHEELERCRLRLRAGTAPARLLFLAPWVADQCHPAELRSVLAETDARARLLLSLGQKRYARDRDAVLG